MKKTAMLGLVLLMCLLAGCAQALTMTGLETDYVDRQWETNAFFARMQALTGVEVQAHGVNGEEEYEALLDAMEKGGAEHDVLFKANLSRSRETALLDSGAIIDLAPYIGEYMPNLSALLEENPERRAVITLEDGRIPSLPLINPQERQAFMWINRTWLERMGLQVPQTIEELTAALEAILASDPNQNGKRDEIPLDLLGVYEMRWLLPYFGIVADDYHLARSADGEIVFAPELPAYREFIAQLKAWHDAGLMRRDAFTGMHSTSVLSEDEDETVVSGMIFSMTPFTHVPLNAIMDYAPVLIPGPDGKVCWRDLLGEVWTGCFAVTSACEDVAAALRWADALYGEAGALLSYAGAEGEDYELDSEGNWTFILTDMRDVNDIRAGSLIYTGVPAPGLYPAEFVARVDSDVDKHIFAASEAVRAVSSRVTLPYALPGEDQARADALAVVLGKLADEGIARFVTGEMELTDENYAAWLAQMEQAGSAELCALYAGT